MGASASVGSTPTPIAKCMRHIEALTYKFYAVVLKEAHDGDTIRLDLDLGFDVHLQKNIRIEDIDAPEINATDEFVREQAMAARDYLRSLLPVGSRVVVHTYKYKRTYDRYVGDIYLEDGRDVSKLMIDAGFAVKVLVDK